MVDEVEQSAVREVEVLEHHDQWTGVGDSLEERAPGAEELLGPNLRFDSQQRQRLHQLSLDNFG